MGSAEKLQEETKNNTETLINIFNLCMESSEYTKEQAANRALKLYSEACESANYFNANVIINYLNFLDCVGD